jgi:hypothetical protein
MAQVQEKKCKNRQRETPPRRSDQEIASISVMFAKRCSLKLEISRFINAFIRVNDLTSVTAVGKAFPHLRT